MADRLVDRGPQLSIVVLVAFVASCSGHAPGPTEATQRMQFAALLRCAETGLPCATEPNCAPPRLPSAADVDIPLAVSVEQWDALCMAGLFSELRVAQSTWQDGVVRQTLRGPGAAIERLRAALSEVP